MTAKEYLEQLAQTAGLTDDVRANLLKAADDQKFAKGLEEGVMLRSDYSRQSDQLKAENKKALDYYNSLVTWRAEEETRLAALTGNNNSNQGNNGNNEYLSKKDLEALDKKYKEELERRERVQIALLKDGMRLASQHAVEFKEPLDTEALEKIAVEKNIPLRAAYEEMVGPRRAETSSAARKAEIEAARAEGAREFASKHKIPVDTQPREHHVIFDRDPKQQVGVNDYVPNSGQLSAQATRQLRDNFAAEWDAAAAREAHTSGT